MVIKLLYKAITIIIGIPHQSLMICTAICFLLKITMLFMKIMLFVVLRGGFVLMTQDTLTTTAKYIKEKLADLNFLLIWLLKMDIMKVI